MKIKALFIPVLVLITLAQTACGASRSATPAPNLFTHVSSGLVQSSPALEAAAATAAPVEPFGQDKSANSSAVGAAGGAAQTQDRLVVKTASITIVVTSPQAKMDAISQMAIGMGGYVVSMNMDQVETPSGGTAPEGTISIRVPVDKLDEARTQIKAGTVDVTNETITGEDITAQYTDLQSQLNNLQQTETDLLAIMDEAKNNPNSNTTSRTQDVLAVYNQIASVRGQIDQIQGQMRYDQQSSSLSLIDVTLVAEKTIQPITIGGWKPQGVARDSIQALVGFLQGFVDFLIQLVLYILPMLILIFGPIVLIIWLIVALIKRRRARKAKAA